MKADTIRQKSIDAPNYSMAFWLKEIAAQLAELNEHLKARPAIRPLSAQPHIHRAEGDYW